MTAEHDQIVDRYAAWLRSWDASSKTIGIRTTMARSRLKAWGMDGFNSDNITTFLGDETFSKWTKATYFGHLRCFCAWLHAGGYIAADPMVSQRKPRRPKSIPRPLSEGEAARVLSVVRPPVSDYISLALLAGLRAGEIAKIRGEDVEHDGVFVTGKGGVSVILPCHPDLWDIAQRYPRSGFWFPGSDGGHMRGQAVSVQVGHLFRSLGIEGSIHRCRHTYATRLLRSGLNVRTVQTLMRHASLDTTAAYTAVQEDELRAGILKLPSLALGGGHPPAA